MEDKLRALSEQGLSQREIAEQLGYHKVSIGRLCKKYGIKTNGSNLKDRTDKKQGCITYISRVGTDKYRHAIWRCRCDCGNYIELKSNQTKITHCGCKDISNKLMKTNSKSRVTDSRIYRVWASMKGRCRYSSVNSYEHYGGKGIQVCEEWTSFENFLDWALVNGYNDALSIDRIDNTKNYCPENCRWATLKEQGRNRSNNRIIEYRGVSKCLVEWAEDLNMRSDTLKRRIDVLGWSIDKAFTTPVAERRKS